MSKNLWFKLMAVLVIAAMMLAGCKQATPEPTQAPVQPTQPPAEQPTQAPAQPADEWANVDPSGQTVLYWHQHSKTNGEALQKIVDEFNATNEWGITVDAEYQGSYNDIFNKMLVVLNTSDAPNLAVAYQNQAATYQLADALIDMNSLVNSPKWGLSEAEQKDFFPGFWAQDVFPTYGNARLGFPPQRSMEVMYYNKEWLAELKAAGKIDFDGPPTNPDQFRAAACAAKDNPFSKATAEGPMGYELSIDASRFASWTFAFNGDVFDYNTSKFTYDSDAATQAWTFLQGLFKDGCASIVTEAYGDQTDFGTGKLLFSVGSSSGLYYYGASVTGEGGANFDWSVGALPYTGSQPAMNIYGASISIPKTTPEQELAAWLFLKFYTSPAKQAEWAKASGYFPVRFSVADSLTDYFAANPTYKTGFDMLQYGKFEPPVPGYDFARNKVGEAMAAIANGDDVAATLKALNEETNAILADQMTSPLPTPVPTPTPKPTAVPIGTADNPINVLFVPSVDANVMTAGGEIMAAALKEATGLEFKVSIPTSYAATIEEMCASPENSMGFIPAQGYVIANQLCGVDVAFKANRYGWGVYWAMFLVQRDSPYQTLQDLEGKKWAYPDAASTSGYLFPKVLLNDLGITPGETLEAGGHPQAVRAIYNGDADFATAFFSPPLKPAGGPAWAIGDAPDIPDDLIPSCAPNEDKSKLMCGDWEVKDARANLREEAPDIVQKVRILALTDAIPNDTLSFGPDFPADLRAQIEAALVAFSKTDGWKQSIGSADFYNWTGLDPATDAEYDPVRKLVAFLGITLESLGK
jgi:phosphate/phosphite/phosphonate ABC transporter binding protein